MPTPAGDPRTATTFFTAKITIPVDPRLLATVDRWVNEGLYANRSQALYAALYRTLERHALQRRPRRYEGHVA